MLVIIAGRGKNTLPDIFFVLYSNSMKNNNYMKRRTAKQIRLLEKTIREVTKTINMPDNIARASIMQNEKDSPVTLILKLSQMLLKWHEAELKLPEEHTETTEPSSLSDIDVRIVQAFLEKTM